ncbi:RDD family protein [Gracilibacillus pellucidus]|uniref:RDD family protein n=1 Tax=Gracilibacillus pellucidus TaxID=3095368 RepID=UPI0039B6F474
MSKLFKKDEQSRKSSYRFCAEDFFPVTTMQGTVGMILLGLKLTDSHSGKKISISKSFVRYIVSCISFFMLGIGFLFALFTDKQKTFHDWVAKTRVV